MLWQICWASFSFKSGSGSALRSCPKSTGVRLDLRWSVVLHAVKRCELHNAEKSSPHWIQGRASVSRGLALAQACAYALTESEKQTHCRVKSCESCQSCEGLFTNWWQRRNKCSQKQTKLPDQGEKVQRQSIDGSGKSELKAWIENQSLHLNNIRSGARLTLNYSGLF